jgi:hypothetical protein
MKIIFLNRNRLIEEDEQELKVFYSIQLKHVPSCKRVSYNFTPINFGGISIKSNTLHNRENSI